MRDRDTGTLLDHPASQVGLIRWNHGHYDILESIPAEHETTE